MTREEAAAHWQTGANDALEVAKLSFTAGKYALALFHCQLAVEKALKALYIEQHDAIPPKTHDLLQLAEKIEFFIDDRQRALLDELSDFATLARYSDGDWEHTSATEERAKHWISVVDEFLSLFHKS